MSRSSLLPAVALLLAGCGHGRSEQGSIALRAAEAGGGDPALPVVAPTETVTELPASGEIEPPPFTLPDAVVAASRGLRAADVTNPYAWDDTREALAREAGLDEPSALRLVEALTAPPARRSELESRVPDPPLAGRASVGSGRVRRR